MICSECGFENKEGAQFCKKCGKPLKSSKGNSSSTNSNKLIIICVAIIALALIIAGAFIFLSNNSQDNAISTNSDNSTKVVEESSAIEIINGTFSTGSSLSDKTYCTVYVGEEYAGENVKISVLYSRDGSNLNQGKIVPKTVDGSGCVSVPSADSFKYYPDHAIVTLYDEDGNVLDTQEVSMSASSGTQSF